MSRRYPLEALADLRQREEETKAQCLAAALARTAQALRNVAEAEQALILATRRRRAAAERVLHSAASAGDLAAGHSYLERLLTEEEVHARRLAEARKALVETETLEASARKDLASAVAEREALDGHRSRWEAERALEQNRRADAELDDKPKRRG